MGNALRDQLLKAGLVDEKQLKKAAKEKHKEANRQHGQGKPDNAAPEGAARRQQDKEEKLQRDRQLNQQRQLEAEKKALQAQVRQLVEQHRQAPEAGEIPFNFVDQGKVKRLYVSEPVRQRLMTGKLAVVRLENRYELIPAETAQKIQGRAPESLVVFNEPGQPEPKPETALEEDPYARFQVPDDLIW